MITPQRADNPSSARHQIAPRSPHSSASTGQRRSGSCAPGLISHTSSASQIGSRKLAVARGNGCVEVGEQQIALELTLAASLRPHEASGQRLLLIQLDANGLPAVGPCARDMADKPAGTDQGRQAADELLARGIDAVPDGSFKRVLKQAGWVGLVLSILIGNVPWSLALKSVIERKAPVGLDTVQTYVTIFVLFTPFVVLFAILGFMVATKTIPQVNGAALLIGAGLLWWVATLVSYSLGGAFPTATTRVPQGGPTGALEYIVSSIGTYINYYGPVPVVAGPIEGAALGYWASVLSRDS